MTIELKEIKRKRRTFLKGDIRGKYWAEEDVLNSNIHSEYFNLNIYEATVRIESIRKDENEGFEEFKCISPTISKLPKPLIVYLKTADFKEVSFEVNFFETKLTNIVLDKVVYEPNQRFGRIRAEIQGCILDEITEIIEVEVPDPIIEENFGSDPPTLIDEATPSLNNEKNQESTIKKPSPNKSDIKNAELIKGDFLDENLAASKKKYSDRSYENTNKERPNQQQVKHSWLEWIPLAILILILLSMLIFFIWKAPFVIILGAIILGYLWLTN